MQVLVRDFESFRPGALLVAWPMLRRQSNPGSCLQPLVGGSIIQRSRIRIVDLHYVLLCLNVYLLLPFLPTGCPCVILGYITFIFYRLTHLVLLVAAGIPLMLCLQQVLILRCSCDLQALLGLWLGQCCCIEPILLFFLLLPEAIGHR